MPRALPIQTQSKLTKTQKKREFVKNILWHQEITCCVEFFQKNLLIGQKAKLEKSSVLAFVAHVQG